MNYENIVTLNGIYKTTYHNLEIHFFELKEEHLKLIQQMTFHPTSLGRDHFPSGLVLPFISVKRPYGNPDIENDLGEMLEIEPEGEEIDEGLRDYSDEQVKAMVKVANQASEGLRICLESLSFEPGLYFRGNGHLGRWQKATEPWATMVYNSIPKE